MATPRTPAASCAHTVIDSPYGPLTLVADGDRLTGLYLAEQRHRPAAETFGRRESPDVAPFQQAGAQLAEYFEGRRTAFELPLELRGTDFQRTVWRGLAAIPYGVTLTYGELAERVGRPTAARAVGLANGRNPIAIVIPCHRVVGSTGALTGYGGGLDRKRRLLALESSTAPRSAQRMPG